MNRDIVSQDVPGDVLGDLAGEPDDKEDSGDGVQPFTSVSELRNAIEQRLHKHDIQVPPTLARQPRISTPSPDRGRTPRKCPEKGRTSGTSTSPSGKLSTGQELNDKESKTSHSGNKLEHNTTLTSNEMACFTKDKLCTKVLDCKHVTGEQSKDDTIRAVDMATVPLTIITSSISTHVKDTGPSTRHPVVTKEQLLVQPASAISTPPSPREDQSIVSVGISDSYSDHDPHADDLTSSGYFTDSCSKSLRCDSSTDHVNFFLDTMLDLGGQFGKQSDINTAAYGGNYSPSSPPVSIGTCSPLAAYQAALSPAATTQMGPAISPASSQMPITHVNHLQRRTHSASSPLQNDITPGKTNNMWVEGGCQVGGGEGREACGYLILVMEEIH